MPSGVEHSSYFRECGWNVHIRQRHTGHHAVKTGIRKRQRLCGAADEVPLRVPDLSSAQRAKIDIESDHNVLTRKPGSDRGIAHSTADIENAHG